MSREARTEERALDALASLLDAVAPGGRAGVLVALSGGLDSTALLHLAAGWRARTGRPVEAAHLDHGLRGADSDADAAFCRALCARLDIRLHERRVDAAAEARSRGRGLEEAGRALRLAFFTELLDAQPRLGACATAHHRDDQLETLLIRLFRGTGPDGLAGVRAVSGRLIRPLLALERAELAAYLEALGEPYRIDATNEDGSNLRGRVRNELVPLIRDVFGPGAPAAPLRLAALLADDAAELDRQAALVLADSPPPATLPVQVLDEQPRALTSRLLRGWLRANGGPERGATHADLARVFDWLSGSRSGSSVDLGAGWRILREFDRLALVPPQPQAAATDPTPELSLRPATPAEIAATTTAAGSEPGPGGWRLTLPRDAVRGRPRLRARRTGDRIVPFGMTGRRKISDILQEARIPERLRDAVPIVEDEAGPLWVVGVIRDERTRLLPTTVDAVTLVVWNRSWAGTPAE